MHVQYPPETVDAVTFKRLPLTPPVPHPPVQAMPPPHAIRINPHIPPLRFDYYERSPPSP